MAASFPPAELEYYEKHASDNIQTILIIVTVVCLVIAFTAVFLRFVARWKNRASFQADDWLILVSLLPLTGMAVTTGLGVRYGEGRHIIFLSNPKGFAIIFISGVIFYALTVVFVKISILCLYHRIFASRALFLSAAALAVLTIAYNTALGLAVLLQCLPLSKSWTCKSDGVCISPQFPYIILSVINVLTDIIILCLPTRFVIRLQMRRTRKLQVLGAFGLGGIVCVFGAVRCWYIAHGSPIDPTWRSAPATIWSQVEVSVGVISACLPVYRPLFRPRREPPRTSKSGFEGDVSIKPPTNAISDHGSDTGGWSSVEAPKLGSRNIENTAFVRKAGPGFFEHDWVLPRSMEDARGGIQAWPARAV